MGQSTQLQKDSTGYYYEYTPSELGQHNVTIQTTDNQTSAENIYYYKQYMRATIQQYHETCVIYSENIIIVTVNSDSGEALSGIPIRGVIPSGTYYTDNGEATITVTSEKTGKQRSSFIPQDTTKYIMNMSQRLGVAIQTNWIGFPTQITCNEETTITNGNTDSSLEATLTYTDKDGVQQPVADEEIGIYNNDTNETIGTGSVVTDEKGHISINSTELNLEEGTYTLRLEYTGTTTTDENNGILGKQATQVTTTVNVVNLINTKLELAVYDTKRYFNNYGKSTPINIWYALINKDTGEYIEDNITLQIDTKTETLTTSSQGSTKISRDSDTTLNPNKNTVTLTYAGSSEYKSCTIQKTIKIMDEIKVTTVPDEHYINLGTYYSTYLVYYNSKDECETATFKFQFNDAVNTNLTGCRVYVTGVVNGIYKSLGYTEIIDNEITYTCNDKNIEKLSFGNMSGSIGEINQVYYWMYGPTITLQWEPKYLVEYTCNYETPCYWGVAKNIVLQATCYDNNNLNRESFPLEYNNLTINGGTLNDYETTTDGLGQANYQYNQETKITSNTNITFTVINTETYSTEATSQTFTVTFIPWDTTTLQITCMDDDLSTPNIDGLYYDIPTIFQVLLLVSPDGDPVTNNKIQIYEENTLIDTVTTNTEGIATFSYTPKQVGVVNFTVYSTEEYHYEQATSNVPITIDKDTPVIYARAVPEAQEWNNTWQTPTDTKETFTFKKANITPEIQIHTTKSNNDNLKGNQNIQLLENFIEDNNIITKLTTGNDGNVKYIYSVRNGLRMVTVVFPETEYYYSAKRSIGVMYDLDEKFTLTIKNYKATLSVDPMVLPLGLYDVLMKFNGDKEHGSSTNNQGIDLKNPTHFTIINGTPITPEAMTPTKITVALMNRNNEKLAERTVTSNFNNIDYEEYTTNTNGEVTREIEPIPITTKAKKEQALLAPTKVGVTDEVEFIFNFTKEEAGCNIIVPVTWAKITPTLEISVPELFYVSTYGTFKCDLYYTRFGQKIPLSNKTVQFMRDNGSTLREVTTDDNGHAEIKYRTSGTFDGLKCHAHFEETETFNEINTPFLLNVTKELTATIVCTDIQAYYNIPCVLMVRLLDEKNNPMSGNILRFKQTETLLGTATTDNNGYASVTYTPTKVGTFKFQVIRYKQSDEDPYQDVEEIFQVTTQKVQPSLTLTSNKTNVTYPNDITLTGKLLANSSPLENYLLFLYVNNKSVATIRTNATGQYEYTFIPEAEGQKTITTEYQGNSNYEKITSNTTVTVNKGNTHFDTDETITIPGKTSQNITIILKNAKNNTLTGKQVTITYNEETITKTTNTDGEITISTGVNDKGVTKTMQLSFNGDTNYNSTTTTITINWGEYQNLESCDDLDAFEPILEDWYAADGTSKYGLDTNKLNNTAKCGEHAYKINCTTIPKTSGGLPKNNSTLLRTVCGDVKTLKYVEKNGLDEDGIHAFTGVIMRSKNLVTTANCTVSFKIYFKYGGGSASIADRMFGGHFGLMDATATTAEKAPLRIEVYRRNVYTIQNGTNLQSSTLAYKIKENTKYNCVFEIKGGNVTMKISDENNTLLASKTFTSDDSFADLHPYAFAFTNDTEFILSEIKITRT